jgi:CBS domain-containing protein
MLVVNISLAIFNLIPAFPMDGGRVIRALLAMRMEYTRATQIAANIGQGIALIFGFFGLFNNPMLLFIAFFVWIGAAQEASMVQVKSALSGIPVDRAMLTNFETLSPTDTLARPVQLILAGSQQDFPVVSPSGAVVGILTREALIRGLSQQSENTLVSYVMDKNITAVDSHQMLDDVSRQMQTGGHNVIPVTHNGLLVGLVTMDNIGEFLMIQAAIKARKTDRRDIIPT